LLLSIEVHTGERDAIMVAAEILGDGRTGNLRMQVIEDFKALTFRYALKDMVSPGAAIRTDDYVSYLTVKQGGMDNITQERSEKGTAFEELHRQIIQFKGWLRGTHHRWSKQPLYAWATNTCLGLTVEINAMQFFILSSAR
jgi:hypothetical protein